MGLLMFMVLEGVTFFVFQSNSNSWISVEFVLDGIGLLMKGTRQGHKPVSNVFLTVVS